MDEATRLQLMTDARVRLDITWDDPDTNKKVLGWIDDGVAYLDSKLGTAGNYLTPGLPRTLLFEYTRYARDAALDVFENNYQSLILAMQNERKVERYELEATAAPAG